MPRRPGSKAPSAQRPGGAGGGGSGSVGPASTGSGAGGPGIGCGAGDRRSSARQAASASRRPGTSGQSAPAAGTPEPGAPEPGTPEPGTPEPGAAGPGPTDRGAINPGAGDTGGAAPTAGVAGRSGTGRACRAGGSGLGKTVPGRQTPRAGPSSGGRSPSGGRPPPPDEADRLPSRGRLPSGALPASGQTRAKRLATSGSLSLRLRTRRTLGRYRHPCASAELLLWTARAPVDGRTDQSVDLV